MAGTPRDCPMDARSKQIAPPKHWNDFEDLCLALFKSVWSDALAQKHGRSGQPQHGVDVFGSPNAGRDKFHGVQCKGKDQVHGSKATIAELKREIAKAQQFSPSLEHWIFATTAPRDQELQQEARELSVARKAQGLFTITVLGWEDVQSMLAEHIQVLQDFYPEQAFDLPGLLETLRKQPTGDEVRQLLAIVRTLVAGNEASGVADAASSDSWEPVGFQESRDLGPALMGRALGPADALACPRLAETDQTMAQLRRAYSARLVGIPGGGKSVCGYQVAHDFAKGGWSVFRMRNSASGERIFPLPSRSQPVLLLVDDVHLMAAHVLRTLEEAAGPRRLVLSIHNGIDHEDSHRGQVSLDPKRAVRTIAAGLRGNQAVTLEAVRRADDSVGLHYLTEPLARRIDHAESVADRPWQFCFVLGGGWRRAKEAADAARAAGADLVLAAAAIHQVASRDAPLSCDKLVELCSEGMDASGTRAAAGWLVRQRLLLAEDDCRCPHQRFSIVVLHRILDGQDETGRVAVGSMLRRAVQEPAHPLGGLWNLLHELTLASDPFGRWSRLIGQDALAPLLGRCQFGVRDEEAVFAILLLHEMDDYIADWPRTVLQNHVSDLGRWISSPTGQTGYGLYRLMNSVHQRDLELGRRLVAASDPDALGRAVSAVTGSTAYNLAGHLDAVGLARPEPWSNAFTSAIDRAAWVALARTWPRSEHLGSFGKFCLGVMRWDDAVALDMIEAFIPTAEAALRRNAVAAFADLEDLFTLALRIFSPLGPYPRRFRPNARRRALAGKICAALKPKQMAAQISSIEKRQLQTATFFLGFLRNASRRKFDGTVTALDWRQLEEMIGDDWRDLPHEAQIFLTAGHSNPTAREGVAAVIERNLGRIERLPARVIAVAPRAAIAHVKAGKTIALGEHGHFNWIFGTYAVALFERDAPEFLEIMLAPSEQTASTVLSQEHPSWYKEAAKFIETAAASAPASLGRILGGIEVSRAETGWAASLTSGGEPRRTAALLVEASLDRAGGVGEMARRLRARFARVSVPKRQTGGSCANA